MDATAGGLVERAAAGDGAAWHALVDQFAGLVWSVARAYRLSGADAEDVFQTTWLRLAEYLHRIEKPERVGAWLAVTARHEAIRVARMRNRAVPSGDLAEFESSFVDDESPERMVLDQEQTIVNSERDRQLWQVFDRLSPRCQALLRILGASPPPTYAQVAEALDMPIGGIGPTRLRCLRHLRDELLRRGITGGFAHS
jgi:RNA polymerase sigma factor (sigma-70 family)